MLGGLLRGNVAIGDHTRELIRQAGSSEKHEGDPHLGDLLEMRIVGGVLRQTGDDTLHVQVDEIVDGPHLVLTVLMGVGTDHRVARLPGLVLDTVEHGGIIVGHQVGHHHTDHARRLFSETLCKRIGTIVQSLCQFLHLFLHLLPNLRRTAQGSADSCNTHA